MVRLHFMKGNMDDMKGTAIAFAKQTDLMNLKDITYHLVYGTLDEESFLQKADVTDLSAIKRQMILERADEDKSRFKPAIYMFPLPDTDSIIGITDGQEDILDAGRADSDFDAAFMTSLVIKSYMKKAAELFEKGELNPLTAAKDTYERFKGDSKATLNHINHTYINQMVLAAMQGETEKYDRLGERFRDFCADASFAEDARLITLLISKINSSAPNLATIDRLVERVSAINGDDLERAQELTDELKDL